MCRGIVCQDGEGGKESAEGIDCRFSRKGAVQRASPPHTNQSNMHYAARTSSFGRSGDLIGDVHRRQIKRRWKKRKKYNKCRQTVVVPPLLLLLLLPPLGLTKTVGSPSLKLNSILLSIPITDGGAESRGQQWMEKGGKAGWSKSTRRCSTQNTPLCFFLFLI